MLIDFNYEFHDGDYGLSLSEIQRLQKELYDYVTSSGLECKVLVLFREPEKSSS